MKITEHMFQNERVDIYKIKVSPEAKEAEKRNDDEKLKKLAYFHSVKKNVIPIIGRERINRILAGEASISNKDTIGESYPNISAIGTSNTVPTENSTKLTNEVFRKYIQSRLYNGNILWIMSRYLPEDCNGSFREEAIFFEGNKDVKDSGYPISIINLTAAEGDKTELEYLIIDRKFILNI